MGLGGPLALVAWCLVCIPLPALSAFPGCPACCFVAVCLQVIKAGDKSFRFGDVVLRKKIRKDKNTTPIKKSNCLTTVMKDNVISSLPPGRYPNAFDMKDKFRYLTPVEMCRLQTLPDDYLDGIAPNTAMSLAGNGWTVDVIAHLLRSIERKQINDIVKEFRKITDELMFGSLETDIM